MKRLNVLVYGDIDLNFMDGSAVWLVSFLKMLTQNPSIYVDLLVKAPRKTENLVASLDDIDNLQLIEPYAAVENYPSLPEGRLTTQSAAKLMSDLDRKNEYHVIFTRGQKLAVELMAFPKLRQRIVPYVTDFQHDQTRSTKQERESLQKIYNYYSKLFLQTKETKAAFQKLLRVDGKKIELLYPMVPDIKEHPSFMNKHNRIIYAGKFHKNWHTEEIISVAQKMQWTNPENRFVVLGDKFQDELRKPERQIPIKNALMNTSNIDWKGAVPREVAQNIIADSDVGIAWRSIELDNDDSVELSCKVLEYGRLGKPILLRRTKMHEEILGSDYPLFVNTREEFEQRLVEVLEDESLYRRCAKQVFEVISFFTYSEAYQRLHDFFWSFYKKQTKIVFAGHDLKFAQLIIAYFQNHPDYDVRLDEWSGHNQHDEEQSKACIEWADIVFCEWGLGNAVWYSTHKKAHQKLVVRLHFQEKDLPFLTQCQQAQVDQFITITPYMFEEFSRIFSIPKNKIIYLDNLVRKEILYATKDKNIDFNLGIIGVLPARKRLDMAIDIFEKLWKKDTRYKLFIKGKMPQEVGWLMARKPEKEYYDQLMVRIQYAPWKKNIIFDAHGNDIDRWFRKIGHLLSTSDYEGSHVAVSEAMSSGTHPVIRNWVGAQTIYPSNYIHESTTEMVKAIEDFSYTPDITRSLKAFASKKFDERSLNLQIENLFNDLYKRMNRNERM